MRRPMLYRASMESRHHTKHNSLQRPSRNIFFTIFLDLLTRQRAELARGQGACASRSRLAESPPCEFDICFRGFIVFGTFNQIVNTATDRSLSYFLLAEAEGGGGLKHFSVKFKKIANVL